MPARSDRPHARVHILDVAGRPNPEPLLIDAPDGLRAGCAAWIWSERRHRWIVCEIQPSPRGGSSYITTVTLAT